MAWTEAILPLPLPLPFTFYRTAKSPKSGSILVKTQLRAKNTTIKKVIGFATNSNEAMDNLYSLFGRIVCTEKRKIHKPKHRSTQTDI